MRCVARPRLVPRTNRRNRGKPLDGCGCHALQVWPETIASMFTRPFGMDDSALLGWDAPHVRLALQAYA